MAWKNSTQMKSAKDIASQIDEAMGMLNSCKVAARDHNFIPPNTVDSALDLAWHHAYNARKFFRSL